MQRICKDCGNSFPLTIDFFYISKGYFLVRCKKCKIEKDRNARELNPKKHKKTCAKYYKRNKKLLSAKKSNNVKQLTDQYISHLLKVKLKDLTPEIIETKRLIIQLKREIIKIK